MTKDANVNKENPILKDFERLSGLHGIDSEIIERSDGKLLKIFLSHPTDRFFKLLRTAYESNPSETLFDPLPTIIKKRKQKAIETPEAKLFVKVISENLTASMKRYQNQSDFFERYIKSSIGAEDLILSEGNHIVYGRRGSGKSSLLLYSMYNRSESRLPSVWIDMEVYSRRNDAGVIIDVLIEILTKSNDAVNNKGLHDALLGKLTDLSLTPEVTVKEIRVLLPNIRRLLGDIPCRNLAIYLDDFHVLGLELQPKLLGILNSICRGNNILLKISAIETSTEIYDSKLKYGLEVPHDTQVINLDYSLTKMEQSTKHIIKILDSYANFCGLPSTRILCGNAGVLHRLVWVAAGVVRDALNIFVLAIGNSILDGQRAVSIGSINKTSSKMLEAKIVNTGKDSEVPTEEFKPILDSFKDFCLYKNKNNAFLIEIKSGKKFKKLKQLIDLRLLHVINEGLTVGEAGRRYIALVLDYGYYVGVRIKRITLFNPKNLNPKYKAFRELPILKVY